MGASLIKLPAGLGLLAFLSVWVVRPSLVALQLHARLWHAFTAAVWGELILSWTHVRERNTISLCVLVYCILFFTECVGMEFGVLHTPPPSVHPSHRAGQCFH